MIFFRKFVPSEELKEDLRSKFEHLRCQFTSLAHAQGHADVVQSSDHVRVLSTVPFALYNGIFRLRLTQDIDAKLTQILSEFRGRNLPGCLFLAPQSQSPAITESLEKQNCRLMAKEFDLALDLKTFKVPLFFLNAVTLEEAQNFEQETTWVNLFFANFGLEDFAKPYFHQLIQGRNSIPDIKAQFLIAKRKGQPIGTLALVHYKDVTGVYCVSVSPQSRSLGSGTMMMASVLKYMRKTECRYLGGNSNEAGYHIYKKAPPLIHLGETHIYAI